MPLIYLSPHTSPVVALPLLSGTHQAIKVPMAIAIATKTQKTCPLGRAVFSIGKNCATEKLASQQAVRPQLWTAPNASESTSSLARMKGTGPSPSPKLVTNKKVANTDNPGTSWMRPIARRKEPIPIPLIENNKHGFLPILSASGAHIIATRTLTTDTITVIRAALEGRAAPRISTLYMITQLIPVACCANIAAMTATTARRYIGSRNASSNDTDGPRGGAAQVDAGTPRSDSCSRLPKTFLA